MKIVMFQPFDNESEEKKIRKTFQIYLQHTTLVYDEITGEKSHIFSFIFLRFLSSFPPWDGRQQK